MQYIRRSHKTGLELDPALFDHGGKLIRSSLAVVGKAESGGQNTLSLCFVFREGGAESRYDFSVKRFIFCDIFSQHLSGFHDQPCGICIKCGSDKILAGGTFITSRRCIQTKPVSVVRASGPQIFCCGMGRNVGNPFLHEGKL